MLTENSGGSDISYLYFLILPMLIFKPSFDVDYNFVLRNFDNIMLFSACSFVAVIVSKVFQSEFL